MNKELLLASLVVFMTSALGLPASGYDDYFKTGLDEFNQGNYNQSTFYFEKAALQRPLPIIYWYEANSYLKLKDYNNALRTIEKVLAVATTNSLCYSLRAKINLGLRDPKSAIEDCNRALNIDRNNAIAYDTRAVAFTALGSNKDALVDRNRAVALRIQSINPMENRGLIQVDVFPPQSKRNSNSWQYNLTPSSSAPIDNRFLANLDLTAGNYEQAAQEYGAAIQSYPNDPNCYYGRAMALEQMDNYKVAIADLTEVMKLTEATPMLLAMRGDLYLEANDLPRALEDFTKGIRIDPHSAINYAGRSSCYLKMRQFQIALADANQSIALDPKFPDTYMIRADIYVAMSQMQNAIDDLDRVMTLQPEETQIHIVR